MGNSGKPWLTKAAASLGFLSIALAALVARLHPATGYELNIYSATPFPFWLLVALSLAIGMTLVVRGAFSPKTGNSWVWGFTLLLLANAVVTLLPLLRGYAMFNPGDSSGHVAFTQDIYQTGRFSIANSYPVNHILLWELSRIGGMSVWKVAQLVMPLFTPLFIVSVYLLGRAVFSDRQAAILGGAAAATLPFAYVHIAFYPNALALLFMPWLIYLYFRGWETPQGSSRYRLLFFLSLPFFVLIHAATSILLIGYLVLLNATKALWQWRNSRVPALVWPGQLTLGPAAVAGIAFFSWISSIYLFNAQVHNFYLFLQDPLRSQHIGTLETVLKSQPLSRWDYFLILFRQFADVGVLALLALLAGVFILWGRRQDPVGLGKPFMLWTLFLVSPFLWAILFLGSGAITIGRLLQANAAMWVAPLLAGFALHHLGTRRRSLPPLAVGLILLFTSFIGVWGVFPSPGTRVPNYQVAERDHKGGEWLLSHNDPNYDLILLGFVAGTGGGIVGYDQMATLREDRRRWYFIKGVAPRYELEPEHFRYREYSSIGDWQRSHAYILLGSTFRAVASDPVMHRTVIPPALSAAPGITSRDLARLEDEDTAVSRIYSNGEFEVLLVRNLAPPPLRLPLPLD